MPRTLSPTTLQKALAPCPNCLTKDSLDLLFRQHRYGPDTYHVRCTACKLEGNQRPSAQAAVAAWNVATEKPIAPRIGCECTAPENTARELNRSYQLKT